MVFAIGARLAEAASENFGWFIGIMAIIALVLLWPRIIRRVEAWLHRR